MGTPLCTSLEVNNIKLKVSKRQTTRDQLKLRWGSGWGGARVYLWLIHVDIWLKPSQNCKVITLQLK